MRWLLLLLLLLMFRESTQEIRDASFKNYCTRVKGQLTVQQLTPGTKNPRGDRCKVMMGLPAENDEEAKENCKLWGAHWLKSGKMVDGRTECVFESIYQCRSDFDQIRGMCYKRMTFGWKTYAEAEQMCKDADAEIIRVFDIQLGAVLEDQFDALTMYFVQPDPDLEKLVTFSGGTGPNYIWFFNYANIYGTGANGIKRMPAHKLAHVMCMYRPEETVLSFSAKAEQLGPLYHPTIVSGESAIWRTAGLYTQSNLPNYDVCERSLKAIIGTNDGTLLNMDPQYTQIFTDKFKESFNFAFAPFAECWDGRNSHYVIYFKSKELSPDVKCRQHASIDDSQYKANFRRHESRSNSYSSVYYSQTTGGYNIESKRYALYGPMICSVTFKPNPLRRERCPDGWDLFQSSSEKRYVCHKYFGEPGWMSFDDSLQRCRDMGAEMSDWTTEDEYHFVAQVRRRIPCGYHCDAWTKCHTKTSCPQIEEDWSTGEKRHPDLRSHDLFWYTTEFDQSVMCQMNAN